MVIVWGSMETTTERLEEALKLSLEHVHRSRGEPGCIRHDVHIDAENRARLVFVEEWEDMPALRAHFAVTESRAFVEKASRLAVRPPEIRIFEASEVR